MRYFCLTIGLLCIFSLPVIAIQNDTRQPIHINSTKQSLDMNANTVIFTDTVIIKQGTIEIHADKVIVLRPDGDQKHTFIEGFGKPVTFVQTQDNGKPVKGHAQKLRYEVENEFIVLTGEAYLEQLDSNITGDKITYLVKQQQMEAFSNKGKHVTTILLPAQLQDKDPQNNKQKKSY